MTKVFITSIGTANPSYKISQLKTIDFMTKVLNLDQRAARKLKVLYKKSAIDTRYSVLEDYGRVSGFSFYPNSPNKAFPSTKERMLIYEHNALALGLEAVSDCFGKYEKQSLALSDITHLITVSCTGMYAPGLDIDLLNSLSLNTSVERTCVNFMGCYASFNALKLAKSICESNPKNKVLIVAVELCTLHLQHSTADDDLIANALFGDGAAAVVVEGKASNARNLALKAFHCDLVSNGSQDMAWQIGNLGFEMKLSSYVADLLGDKVQSLVQRVLAKIDLRPEDIDTFAIHPGGKRILEKIEQVLSIQREKNQLAFDILRDYGNMSSVSILFLLEKILQEESNNAKNILSMAFGPGLTMEAGVLEVIT